MSQENNELDNSRSGDDKVESVKQEHLSADKEISMVDPKGEAVEAVILPASIYSDIFKAVSAIDNVANENFAKEYSAGDSLSVGIVADSLRVTVKQNALVKTLRNQEAEWMQVPSYADKALAIRELAIGGKGKGGKVTGAAAAAKFYSHLGLGGLIQVPLWHSGFWITLKAIKESELLNLEMALANNQITLGRETNTLIFSNYSVVFVRLIMEFITRHIQSCSLELNDINDITKFIKVQDLYPIANGLIQSIYLKGFKDVRTCVNSTDINATTGKPKCDHTMTSTIDPKKLLWVNKKELSDKHLEQMTRRGPGTVTENDVLEYQASLNINKSKEYQIETESGNYATIKLKSPYISKHIEQGEKWVNDVIELTEKLFTDNISVDEKNTRIKTASKMVLLAVYNHFVESIEMNGDYVDELEDINLALEIFVSDKIAFKAILKVIKDYIDLNTIAIVAIPNYKCPNCEEEQRTANVPTDFKDLIPINVLETFFDLSTLKTSEVSQRDLD